MEEDLFMEYVIENDNLIVVINSKGCEITDITNKKNNKKCLWNGNPNAWKRHSPVLFPVIGKYKDNSSIYEGKEYHMGQHGFARDMEFEPVRQAQDEMVMRLVQNEDTLEKYPFKFELECGYKLSDNSIVVSWKVTNTNDKTMYFSIGGHPAFIVPQSELNMELNNTKNATGCKLLFKKNGHTVDNISYFLLDTNGLVMPEKYSFKLDGGQVKITENFFEKDAYIIEDSQADEVSLIDDADNIFVTVQFTAPVFGVWSAAGKKVPFVCIEPWYGRADGIDSDNRLENRKWNNILEAGHVFEKSYSITF